MSANIAPIEKPDTSEQDETRQYDYLLLTIFVLSQHGHYERAGILVEGMIALGDTTREVILARAVLEFFKEHYAACLDCLDQIDALDSQAKFKETKETKRMRAYLRARCHFQSGDEEAARNIAKQLTSKPINGKIKK